MGGSQLALDGLGTLETTHVDYRRYRVRPKDREPLLLFMLDALKECGCTILAHTPPTEAPFRITCVTPTGERLGILAYAFLANDTLIKNRPPDEWRFQVKYGSDSSGLHEIWQDPFNLYTTLLLGISPEHGFFVAADPVHNNPTPFYISKEFKQVHVDAVLDDGWTPWERGQREGGRRGTRVEATEILLGGMPRDFLKYVLFEREARGEDQGHRHLLAEEFGAAGGGWLSVTDPDSGPSILSPQRLHLLEREFALPTSDILSLIDRAPRLKMAVRGWVAEEHLYRLVRGLPGITSCERIEQDGQPDLRVQYRNSRPILIECKNVLRKRDAQGNARIDLMKSRHSKNNPCNRYYKPEEFDVVAACLHATTEVWEFRGRPTRDMSEHDRCTGRLSHKVVVDASWSPKATEWFERVLSA